MTSHIFRKNFNALRPTDEAGQATLRGIANNALVKVKITQSRNLKHHAKLFVLLDLVHRNLPERSAKLYPTVESMLDAIKLYVGLREAIMAPSGKLIGYRPGSIAFHNMGQAEFDDFYNRVIDLICEHFIPGMAREDLRREVLELCGREAA